MVSLVVCTMLVYYKHHDIYVLNTMLDSVIVVLNAQRTTDINIPNHTRIQARALNHLQGGFAHETKAISTGRSHPSCSVFISTKHFHLSTFLNCAASSSVRDIRLSRTTNEPHVHQAIAMYSTKRTNQRAIYPRGYRARAHTHR